MEKELTKKQAQWKKWYEENKEEFLKKKSEYKKEYYKKNKKKVIEHNNNYKKNTVKGRAVRLNDGYRTKDLKYRGCIGNMTADYMVDVLFPKGCIYCGEKDPMKLGCDRIDNSKPHNIDNCVCCCGRCNTERHLKDFQEFFNQKFMETILE